jgi:predicted nucleotidyltransferase component of viral defense system
VLEAFFRRERNFFLTGGAALAGYHLQHRHTEDLDLFTIEENLDDADRALAAVAEELGGTLEQTKTTQDFRRRIVRHGDEAVVVDLVHDRAPQGEVPKVQFGAVRVDPPEEILANKLCTLLSRSELRDLVDVYALEEAGFRVEDALPLAQRKDGGLTPLQLDWVLSQIDLARLPDGKIVLAESRPSDDAPTRNELQQFLRGLSRRLLLLSPHP